MTVFQIKSITYWPTFHSILYHWTKVTSIFSLKYNVIISLIFFVTGMYLLTLGYNLDDVYIYIYKVVTYQRYRSNVLQFQSKQKETNYSVMQASDWVLVRDLWKPILANLTGSMTRRVWMEKTTAVKCRCEMLNWADDDWIKDPIISVILIYKM